MMYAAQKAPAVGGKQQPGQSRSASGSVSACEMRTTPSAGGEDGGEVGWPAGTARSARTSGPMNSIVTATPIGRWPRAL